MKIDMHAATFNESVDLLKNTFHNSVRPFDVLTTELGQRARLFDFSGYQPSGV